MRIASILLLFGLSLICACREPTAEQKTPAKSQHKTDGKTTLPAPEEKARVPTGPVVVSTATFGNLHASDLVEMRRRRQKVGEFFVAVYSAVSQSGGFSAAAGDFLQNLGPDSDQAVVDTWLLAREAQRRGMVVDDRAIDAFLGRAVGEHLQASDVEAILEKIGLTQRQLFDALHDELAAIWLQKSFALSLAGSTPAERWDYFRRLERRAKIELVAIPVARYIDRVPPPDEAALKQLFEEHKTFFSHPDSPAPGFRVPHRITLEYFQAKEEAFLDPDAVGREEIELYYEQFKDDHYRRLEPPADAANETDQPAAEQPPYVPLKEVEGEVRRLLAKEHAADRIKQIFDELSRHMQAYREQWLVYQQRAETDPAAEPPAKLDFAALAERYGLTTGKTPPVSRLEAADYPIGKSNVRLKIPLLEYAFDESFPLYQRATSFDSLGNHYLFWKVADEPERVPDFDDEGIRPRVMHAWKMLEARRLAIAEAERLAAAARGAKLSLEAAFAERPDLPVLEPDAFSWRTYGNIPPAFAQVPPQLGEVTGIQYPGEEFMRTVFDLEPGGIAVAMNQPETVVCIVRLIETAPPETVLWKMFLVDPYSRYAAIAAGDRERILRAWHEGIAHRAGLVWESKPD